MNTIERLKEMEKFTTPLFEVDPTDCDTAFRTSLQLAWPQLRAVFEAAEYFCDVYEGGGAAFIRLQNAVLACKE